VTFFYWFMVVVILGTFVPSVLFFVMYVATGDDDHANRAKGLWTVSRLFTLFGLNVLIWGHVAMALWQLWAG
jgi:hypothetical protein